MDSKALINETLKYLEKNENGQPKYRFDIYRNGVAQSINKATSLLTAGVVNDAVAEDKSAPTPVSVYTIGDIFSTAKSVRGDAATVFQNIKNLPSELDNVKASLKQLGFNALDKTIDTIKAAVVPIEVIQTVNSIYRVARPLVEKVVDIASIMFHFENAAKVAQDVLQYLSRLAVSTARNYLNRLWELFLDTPVFAVYENDETASLSGAYALLSSEANNVLESLANSFNDMLTYINSASDKKMYEPGYNNLGITIPDDIVDVYSDPNTRKIFIASSTEIYQLNEDYSTTLVAGPSSENITKVFYYNGNIYYITNNKIYKLGDSSYTWTTLSTPIIVYSNPLLIYNNGEFYNPETKDSVFSNTFKYSAFDHDRKILYLVNSSDILYAVTQDITGNYMQEELGTISDIYDMAYFNDALYVVTDDGTKRKVEKFNAGVSFNKSEYTGTDKIISLNNNVATDGSYVYSRTGNSTSFSVNNRYPGAMNSVIKQSYGGSNYLIATGGTDIHITRDGNNNWYDKSLDSNGITINLGDSENPEEIPDNFSGCLWFVGQAGTTFIAHSQNNIYAVANDDLAELFSLPPVPGDEIINVKDFSKFEQWFDDQTDTEPPSIVHCSAKLPRIYNDSNRDDYDPLKGCIITKIKKIGNKLYIAIYNPLLDSYSSGSAVKSGIYELVISHPSHEYLIDVLLSNPVYTVGNTNHKIYSFDKIDNVWYFTDGTRLYNATTGSETNLGLDNNDRALEIVNESGVLTVYTSKAKLTKKETVNLGEIKSSIKYKSAMLHLASTENILMISDESFIYSSVDNGDDAINSELFQVCFKKGANDFNLIQSNNAAFIISKNSIKKVPLYDSISSSDYGCGYYTDTTPNKWMGAAPYYFVSNSLNNKKNTLNRDVFIKGFKENFKVELEKLLRHIPDAFVSYMNDKLVAELKKTGVEIDGDDGQIADLMINSVASTMANSIGMYVHDKFMEKIGDDSTYETFAENVYQACLEDATNNMTKDFYDIFSELYISTITEALSEMNFGPDGISAFLLRYYQNHKAEWAQSMTDLIDVDIVDPDYYEIPLKSTESTTLEDTYVFDYDSASYVHKYVATPAKEYDRVIDGYLYDNDFHADASDASTVIDHRTWNTSDATWSMNGEIIAYKNPADNQLYRYKVDDFVLSESESVVSGTDYYERAGDSYVYALTSDTSETKPYYRPETYTLSSATSVIPGVGYYVKSGSSEISYELASAASGVLELGTYYEKPGYAITSDTQIDSEKTYYQQSYVAASSAETGVQYYKKDYVKTTDTVIDPDKTYFEYINLSKMSSSDPVYIPAPDGTTATRYSVNFKLFGIADYTFNGTYYTYDQGPSDYPRYNVTFTANQNGNYIYSNGHYVYSPDSGETKYSVSTVTQPNYIFDNNTVYYVLVDGVYQLAETLDIQYGPYYYADGFVVDSNGDYILSTMSNVSGNGFSEVAEPKLENLSTYYEFTFTPVASYESESYKLDYISVTSPSLLDLSSYYEENDEYNILTDPKYVYNDDGEITGIELDRVLYKAVGTPLTYTFVENPTGSPVGHGWYEAATYSQIISGSTTDPASDHLYQRTYNPVSFIKVENPSGSPAGHEWYEYSYSYISPFTDNRLYINKSAVPVTSYFPYYDDRWHNSFYTSASQAASAVLPGDNLDQAKQHAIAALDGIVFPYPEWQWEALLNESVTMLYIPKQGDQFRQIVMDSNMYPIQWQELPYEIDRKSFDYALTTLLYMIKQRLLTNITILVDGGKVKCYSCVDATTVIKKIISRNHLIWRNQIRTAKAKVEKATSKNEVISVFNMVKAYDKTLYLLENILNEQSRLYARYIDMLIEEQIINDNETEVTL